MKTNLPWIEKYRPQKLDDIVGNREIVEKLKKIVKTGNLGNIILSGSSGIGKTTSILCMAHEILGPNYNEAVLHLNASDENGIDIIRNQVKIFAQRKMSLSKDQFKIIILDEIDAMKKDAQNALRGIMEKYSNGTRFILACNYSSKITESIQSRCAILRYKKLDDDEILERLKYVCEQENVSYDIKGLNAIIFTANGDMRNALNNLQSTVSRYREYNREYHTSNSKNLLITEDRVYTICDIPSPTIIKKIVDYCLLNNINEAIKIINQLIIDGYAVTDLIKIFFDTVKYDNDLNETLKLEILKEIGDTIITINNGLDTNLQLVGLCARLCEIK